MNETIKQRYLDKTVGMIEFDGKHLYVYRDLNDPLFYVPDVCELMDEYTGSRKGHYYITERCELDEIVNMCDGLAGPFVTETGLYNILSHSYTPLGRKWRRVVHDEIVKTRRQRGLDIIEKFDEWDDMLDTLYFDEETGILMQSVTVAGGDVEQVPFKYQEG